MGEHSGRYWVSKLASGPDFTNGLDNYLRDSDQRRGKFWKGGLLHSTLSLCRASDSFGPWSDAQGSWNWNRKIP